MSDINAAIGNAQLKRFKFLAKKRQSIAKLYDKIFLKKNHLLKIFNRDYNKEVPHIYCVVLNNSTDRDKLREKLQRVGLDMGDVAIKADNGKITTEVKQFGGRFGKDTDGSDINDDGISHKKEGGLKMEISYETLRNGTSKVYAKLV